VGGHGAFRDWERLGYRQGFYLDTFLSFEMATRLFDAIICLRADRGRKDGMGTTVFKL